MPFQTTTNLPMAPLLPLQPSQPARALLFCGLLLSLPAAHADEPTPPAAPAPAPPSSSWGLGVGLIYQQKAYEGHAKDYEFSGTSMREHWQSGYEDTKRTLKRREWLQMPVHNGGGITVHDVHRESESA